MSNIMQSAASWLGEQLKTAAPRAVVFSQAGRDDSGSVTGTVAEHEYQVVDRDGFSTSVRSYDWTFETDDLPWTPRAGDRLRETLNSVVTTYEIMPLDKLPAVHWLDTSGILTQIHTKKVES